MFRPWIQLASGTAFFLDNVDNNAYRISDIAHALSNQCRFSGHVSSFYSVAEHSVHCSYLVPPQYALTALLHDASEAYLGDVSKPLKAMLPEYCKIEDRVMRAIARTFAIEYPFPEVIKTVDVQVLFAERNRLIGPPVYPWIGENDVIPASVDIQCWGPVEARNIFLRRYYELTGKD